MKQFMFTKTNKMIKNTLLIFFLFVGLNTVAQNRLEFNQVINISSDTPASDKDTVPQNKVWKIVGAFSTNSSYTNIWINGLNMDPNSYYFPYWLKEGEIVGATENWQYATNQLEISIIEFNIITD